MTATLNHSLVTTLRARRAARSARRHERIALEHDLAQFRSERDRIELDMILSRNPADEADEIRRVHARVVALHR